MEESPNLNDSDVVSNIQNSENRDLVEYINEELILIKYDINDEKALKVIKEDIGRQLGLVSDRRNTMVQSIGIIMAFASVLFAQIITVGTFEGISGIYFTSSLLCLFSCGAMGIFTILKSTVFVTWSGMKIDEEAILYNKGDTKNLEVDIVNGMNEALEETSNENEDLIFIIRLMATLLMIGMAIVFVEWMSM